MLLQNLAHEARYMFEDIWIYPLLHCAKRRQMYLSLVLVRFLRAARFLGGRSCRQYFRLELCHFLGLYQIHCNTTVYIILPIPFLPFQKGVEAVEAMQLEKTHRINHRAIRSIHTTDTIHTYHTYRTSTYDS